MKIAIWGRAGSPPRTAGFETLAEELSARLAAAGTTSRSTPAPHGVGARRLVAPRRPRRSPSDAAPEVPRHGRPPRVSGLHAAAEGYDAVLVCNGANALLCRLPRLLGAPSRIVLNVDGLERNRRKWNRLGRLVYALSERLSCVMPDAVVTDALAIRAYYRASYGRESVFIPYGSDLPSPTSLATLERLGLLPGGYVLYVSRFEPENNADAVVRAFRGCRAGRSSSSWARPRTRTASRTGPRRGRSRSASSPARGALRRGVPRAPRERRDLRARDRGGRHAPRARRGDGLRPAAHRARHPGESRGGGGRRALRGRAKRREPRCGARRRSSRICRRGSAPAGRRSNAPAGTTAGRRWRTPTRLS